MTFARAFTMRAKRPETPEVSGAGPARFASVKKRGSSFDRKLISSPVFLLSTTNMLSYNAPDIASLQSPSSSSSSTHSSAEDSDAAGSSLRSRGSKDTFSTDPSSCESSPTSSEPEPNHLTGYFKYKGPRRAASSSDLLSKFGLHSPQPPAAPAIPQRALTHSKVAHERLARQRSLQHMAPPSTILEHRSSMELLGTPPATGTEHPFGKELEHINEIAEEFGGVARDAAWEEDMGHMKSRHLARFCATEYMHEIQPLFAGVFEDAYTWI